MISIIDGGSTALVSTALDAATLRQQAISQNIANAATPGYKRLEVSFEARVAALSNASGHVRAPQPGELASLRPYIKVADGDASVALDTEVAKMADNTLHHQVLLKALSKHYALLSTAVSDGKR